MTIFDDFRDLATDLLLELAVPVTLGRIVRLYDAETRVTTSVPAAYPARGVLTPPPGGSQVERAAGSTQMTTQFALIGSIDGGVEPAVDDNFTIGGRAFRINGVSPLRPDGAAIVWRLALEDA